MKAVSVVFSNEVHLYGSHPVLVLCVASVGCSVSVHGLLLCMEFVEYSSLYFLSLVVVFNFSVALVLLLSVEFISVLRRIS